MRTPGKLIPVVAATALLTAQVQAQSERSTHFLAKQCNEDAITLRVDPAPLQRIVGPAFSLLVDEGKARILVVAHDCAQYWMDGENVGPTQETQIWALIHGIGDVRPVVGAELTLPTRTWFTLLRRAHRPGEATAERYGRDGWQGAYPLVGALRGLTGGTRPARSCHQAPTNGLSSRTGASRRSRGRS